jgi:hypothetical protein
VYSTHPPLYVLVLFHASLRNNGRSDNDTYVLLVFFNSDEARIANTLAQFTYKEILSLQSLQARYDRAAVTKHYKIPPHIAGEAAIQNYICTQVSVRLFA